MVLDEDVRRTPRVKKMSPRQAARNAEMARLREKAVESRTRSTGRALDPETIRAEGYTEDRVAFVQETRRTMDDWAKMDAESQTFVNSFISAWKDRLNKKYAQEKDGNPVPFTPEFMAWHLIAGSTLPDLYKERGWRGFDFPEEEDSVATLVKHVQAALAERAAGTAGAHA